MKYVDVHTHLTHEKFDNDRDEVIKRASDAQVTMVVNGLEPRSNRTILELAERFDHILPALGIYPLESLADTDHELPFKKTPFDVKQEVNFIAEQAASGKIAAVGECGLDGHWAKKESFATQEEVFEQLLEIGEKHQIPVIIHSRKLEKRVIEILEHHNQTLVDFHCYCGKSKLALRVAEQHGWCFSIPANARKSESFTKLLRTLPEESILSETDAPYLAPVRGERNEPKHVVGTVEYLAELRSWPTEKAAELIWTNFQRLFRF